MPTRRTVLAGGALGLVAACRKSATPKADPDAPLRAAALEREQQLVAAYEAVIAAVPAQAAGLRPLAADKASHVAVLGSSPAVTSTVRTVAQLRLLEQSTAAAYSAAALQASTDLAPLLASLAASSATAAAVL